MEALPTLFIGEGKMVFIGRFFIFDLIKLFNLYKNKFRLNLRKKPSQTSSPGCKRIFSFVWKQRFYLPRTKLISCQIPVLAIALKSCSLPHKTNWLQEMVLVKNLSTEIRQKLSWITIFHQYFRWHWQLLLWPRSSNEATQN